MNTLAVEPAVTLVKSSDTPGAGTTGPAGFAIVVRKVDPAAGRFVPNSCARWPSATNTPSTGSAPQQVTRPSPKYAWATPESGVVPVPSVIVAVYSSEPASS